MVVIIATVEFLRLRGMVVKNKSSVAHEKNFVIV